MTAPISLMSVEILSLSLSLSLCVYSLRR